MLEVSTVSIVADAAGSRGFCRLMDRGEPLTSPDVAVVCTKRRAAAMTVLTILYVYVETYSEVGTQVTRLVLLQYRQPAKTTRRNLRPHATRANHKGQSRNHRTGGPTWRRATKARAREAARHLTQLMRQ